MNAPIPIAIARELTLPADMTGCGELVMNMVTAYDGLPTPLALMLDAQLSGDLNVPETYALAGRLLDEVPLAQMQLIVARLLCMADERPAHGGFVETPVDIDLTLPAGIVAEQDC